MSSGFDRLGANVKGKNLDSALQFVTVRGARLANAAPLPRIETTPAPAPAADISVTLLDSEKLPVMTRAQAIQSGFTGDSCDHCGSSRMKNTGHCNTCEECGTTTGCS